MSATHIIEQIRSLDPAERRELVERVWTEFGSDIPVADDEPTAEQIAEFERSVAYLQSLDRLPGRPI